MREPAVIFDAVWKSYPSYLQITGGIKSFIFNLPRAVGELRTRRTALEGVSFEIYKGENFGFIGRNGAGKSTTLGLIAGVLSPDKGNVRVNGRVSPLLALGAGFHPELSGRGNILLNGVLLGLLKEEVLSHEQEIIDFAELGDFIDQPVRTYSSGMYARLGFAVVTTLKPEILLLDEILAVGDIAFQNKCHRVFEDFRNNPNVTMVLVSHSLSSVEKVCDRAAWIEGKRIQAIGPADAVIREYKAAYAPKAQVPDIVAVNLPVHVAPGTMELDCSSAPATFFPKVSAPFPDSRLRITLFQRDEPTPLGHCSIVPQSVSLYAKDGELLLETADGKAHRFVPDTQTRQEANLHRLLTLSLQAEGPDGPQGAASWLPLYATAEARQVYKAEREQLLTVADGSGFPPHLWPGGKTVRVVARNIMVNDAVGNFAVSVAATLMRYGIPARLYAYASCAELAGLTASIGDLKRETEPDDIVFYNYSTEDEFLPMVTELECHRKILYYHNVTPGHWFREHYPDLADALERARKQYHFFSAFDAAAANSAFSLEEILPHLAKDTPTSVFPPSMSPNRLVSLKPETIPAPETPHTILWVGRVAPHKRPALALHLFESLSRLRDDTALVLVASGRRDFPLLFQRLEYQLTALPQKTRERVCILEELRDAQLAWLYRRASLLLCTSGHEGYCLPVREALSFGVPVAALPQPAVEETMNGRGTVLPENIDQAARVLHEMLSRESGVSLSGKEKDVI